MNFSIRTYSESYRNQVADLILEIQREEFGIPITLEAQPDLGNIPQFYQTGYGNFWVAHLDDKVIGTISLLDIGEKRGALRKMFVKREHRGSGSGVAQALLRALLDWAEMKKMNEILLGTTEKFLAAHRFYEKNQFVEIRKDELPLGFPVMSVDVKFYKLKLNNV